MAGGTTSMDDMIKSTPRGVLVTRLWYLRQVDPRTILLHRTHARRNVPDRERKDLEGDQEFPLQRVAAVSAQQSRGDRSGRAARRNRSRRAGRDAGDQGARFQLHEFVGRGVARGSGKAGRGLGAGLVGPRLSLPAHSRLSACSIQFGSSLFPLPSSLFPLPLAPFQWHSSSF